MVEMMDNYLCLISGEYGMMNNSRIYFMEKIDTVVLQGEIGRASCRERV